MISHAWFVNLIKTVNIPMKTATMAKVPCGIAGWFLEVWLCPSLHVVIVFFKLHLLVQRRCVDRQKTGGIRGIRAIRIRGTQGIRGTRNPFGEADGDNVKRWSQDQKDVENVGNEHGTVDTTEDWEYLDSRCAPWTSARHFKQKELGCLSLSGKLIESIERTAILRPYCSYTGIATNESQSSCEYLSRDSSAYRLHTHWSCFHRHCKVAVSASRHAQNSNSKHASNSFQFPDVFNVFLAKCPNSAECKGLCIQNHILAKSLANAQWRSEMTMAER